MTTICEECMYKIWGIIPDGKRDPDTCSHPDAPVSNFVTGEKSCYEINKKGECKWYEAKD